MSPTTKTHQMIADYVVKVLNDRWTIENDTNQLEVNSELSVICEPISSNLELTGQISFFSSEDNLVISEPLEQLVTSEPLLLNLEVAGEVSLFASEDNLVISEPLEALSQKEK